MSVKSRRHFSGVIIKKGKDDYNEEDVWMWVPVFGEHIRPQKLWELTMKEPYPRNHK